MSSTPLSTQLPQEKVNKTLTYRFIMLALIILMYFFVYLHRTSTAVMAPELVKDFGISPVQLGLFGSFYFYFYALLTLPTGLLVDRWGARNVISCWVLAGIGAMVFAMATTFNGALAGRALIGMGVCFIFVPATKIVATWFKTNEFGTYSGVLLAVGNIGSLAAAAPLVAVMAAIGWRNTMWAVGIASVILAVLALFLIKNKPEDIGGVSIAEIEGIAPVETAAPVIGIGTALKQIWSNVNFWYLGILMFFFYGSMMGLQGLWGGPYLQHVYGFTKAQAGNYLMLIAAGMIVGCPLAGYLSDKVFKSRKKVLLGGAIGYTLCWIPFVFMIDSMSPVFLSVMLVLYGLFAGFFVINFANSKQLFSPALAGTAVASVNMFNFIGGALIQQVMSKIISIYPKVSATVYSTDGYRMAFLFCFIAMVISVLIYTRHKEAATL